MGNSGEATDAARGNPEEAADDAMGNPGEATDACKQRKADTNEGEEQGVDSQRIGKC